MNRNRQSNLSSTKAVFTLAPKHVSKIISAILENFNFNIFNLFANPNFSGGMWVLLLLLLQVRKV